jgi:hypothetical protein
MDYSAWQYRREGRLEFISQLYICEDENSPMYLDHRSMVLCVFLLIEGVTEQCRLTVNLRDIPASGFKRKTGPKVEYYKVHFSLGVMFGPGGIEFSFIYDRMVVGSVTCDYE